MSLQSRIGRAVARILFGVAALTCFVWARDFIFSSRAEGAGGGRGPCADRAGRSGKRTRLAQEKADQEPREAEHDAKEEAERQEADRKAAEETRLRDEQEAKRREEEQSRLEEEQKKIAAIRDEVSGMATRNDEALPARPTGLKGKALVLDCSDGGAESLQFGLPDGLKGKPDDPDLVVFLVDTPTKVQTKTYEDAGGNNAVFLPGTIPGYRLDHRVRVVSWPTRTLLGDFTIHGDELPETLSIDPDNPPKEFTGGYKDAVQRWAAGRFGEVPTLEKFLAATDDKEATDLVDDLVKQPKDLSAIPYLAKKLKESTGAVRYQAIRALRNLSGVDTFGRNDTGGGSLEETFKRLGRGFIEYPMGPEDQVEFDLDPDGWVTKWLDWAGERR